MTGGTEIIFGLGLWLAAGAIGWMIKGGKNTSAQPDLVAVNKSIEEAGKLAPLFRAGLILATAILAAGCGLLIPGTDGKILAVLGLIAGWSIVTGGLQPAKNLAYILAGLAAARVSSGLLLSWLTVWVLAEVVRGKYGDIPGIGLNPIGCLGTRLGQKYREIVFWKKEAGGGIAAILAKYGSGLKTETVKGGKLYDCPVCSGEMEERKITLSGERFIIMDQCPECGSVRYDRAEQSLAAAAILLRNRKTAKAAAGLACPRCRETMTKANLHPPVTEAVCLTCSYCHGYFLTA